MRKIWLVIFTCITVIVFGQKNKNEVEINWKIGESDMVIYKTILNDVDTSVVEFDFGGLGRLFSERSGENVDEARNLFKKINEQFKDVDLVTTLTSKEGGVVDVVMQTRPKGKKAELSDSSGDKMAQVAKMMQMMNQGVMLRGSLYENGSIHSFWVKSQQKNLIAMFFQLPNKAVKVGDTWKIDVDLIANDQNFECDSAYKINRVTFEELKKEKGERIAVLKYEIEEYVHGDFNMPMFGNGKKKESMIKFTYYFYFTTLIKSFI